MKRQHTSTPQPQLSFADGDTVVVGVSGGADSVALLHMLLHSGRELNVNVCHVNHNLRGAESLRDRDFVVALCQQWRLRLFLQEPDVQTLSRQRKQGIEECAREVRYRFFAQTADNLSMATASPVYIATGHTQSDQVETLLFRLCRGTGLKGLTGIPFQRDNIIRPLIGLTREEILSYCSFHALDYVTDSSNFSPVFARNQIRLEILPTLKQIHHNIEKNIANTAALLSADEDFLHGYTKQLYDRFSNGTELSLVELRTQHPAIQRRILRHFFEANSLSVSGKNTLLAHDLINSGGKMQLGDHVYLCAEGDVMLLSVDQPATVYQEFHLSDGFFESWTAKVYKVHTLEIQSSVLFHKIVRNPFDIFLDCGKIQGSVIIRPRKPGDTIQLQGRTHSKSFKKIFQEQKIPIPLRAKLFVLQDEQGVIALEGVGIAQRVTCSEFTTRCMMVLAQTHMPTPNSHRNSHVFLSST